MGYSVRYPFEEFVDHFRIIAFKHNENPPRTKETADKILSAASVTDFALGHTLVFMKYGHAHFFILLLLPSHTYVPNNLRYDHIDVLTKEAQRHTRALIFLQKVVKGFMARERCGDAVPSWSLALTHFCYHNLLSDFGHY